MTNKLLEAQQALEFRRVEERRSPHRPDRRMAGRMSGGKPCVLIVDDEQPMHDTLRFVLKSRANVLSVFSAEDGLRILEDLDTIQLVFLDLTLPGMNGLDMLPIVKRRWPWVQIAVVSSTDDPGVQALALRRGAFRFMRKDFDFDWMQELLTTVLESAKSNREHAELMDAVHDLTYERVVLQSEVTSLSEQFTTTIAILATLLPLLAS